MTVLSRNVPLCNCKSVNRKSNTAADTGKGLVYIGIKVLPYDRTSSHVTTLYVR